MTDAIRAPDIGMGASTVSAHKAVRDALLDMQRQAGRDGGVVLEGRDIGTVVFPDADVKFFLTARPEVRARRRFDELVAKGARVSFEETLADVRRRDEQDTTRAVAPLRQAPDATLVDSSEMGIDEAVARMAERVRGGGGWVRAAAGALAVIAAIAFAVDCASPARPSTARTAPAEPRWEDVIDATPELLAVVFPRALRRDAVYGPLLRGAIDLVREQSRVVAETRALDAMEDAEEVIVGVRPDAGAARGEDGARRSRGCRRRPGRPRRSGPGHAGGCRWPSPLVAGPERPRPGARSS